MFAKRTSCPRGPKLLRNPPELLRDLLGCSGIRQSWLWDLASTEAGVNLDLDLNLYLDTDQDRS
jgi:hypothetical protein